MAWLIDTSVLVRLADSSDPAHSIAALAVLRLHRQGQALHATPQVLVEFRNVATRPRDVNGLGLTAAQTEAIAAQSESDFPILHETPDIFPAWKAIVQGLGVVGKQVHDARLVAVCQVHRVSHLLTFNVGHFTRLAGFVPGLTIVDPAIV